MARLFTTCQSARALFTRVLALSVLWCVACDRVDEVPTKPPDATPVLESLSVEGSEGGASPPRSKRRPKSIVLAELRDEAAWLVADGYLTRNEIVGALKGMEPRVTLADEIAELVDEAFAEHRQLEAHWRGATDPDRLARAFAALERERIVARERFADCHACAKVDLEVLADDAKARGAPLKGYAYFTDQDADGVSDSHALTITTGGFADNDEAITQRVLAVLRANHLPAQLDDEGNSVVRLEGLDWKKRRFSRAPRR